MCCGSPLHERPTKLMRSGGMCMQAGRRRREYVAAGQGRRWCDRSDSQLSRRRSEQKWSMIRRWRRWQQRVGGRQVGGLVDWCWCRCCRVATACRSRIERCRVVVAGDRVSEQRERFPVEVAVYVLHWGMWLTGSLGARLYIHPTMTTSAGADMCHRVTASTQTVSRGLRITSSATEAYCCRTTGEFPLF